jgi:hypothetical protein
MVSLLLRLLKWRQRLLLGLPLLLLLRLGQRLLLRARPGPQLLVLLLLHLAR